ncbi:MAG: DUF2089 domain-containing protein [Chlorobi bacterium]|nr:DUF2089 domain-containing protein [Chlorobiota bacterium]
MNKKLPIRCPSCESFLKVKQLQCDKCETEVSGLYSLPIISQLSIDDQKFILDFAKASGSLKIMAQNMNLSYPTVRNKLDEIINSINTLETNED